MINKININNKFSLFSDHWSPKILASINDHHVKIAKLKGDFIWHKHDNEDELFFVIRGKLIMEFRDRTIELNEQEMLVVPKGVEHRPVALDEVCVILIEPATTINTGDKNNELTRINPEFI